MRRALIAIALSPLAMAGCATDRPSVAAPAAIVEVEQLKVWEEIATPADEARLAGLSERWTHAHAAVPRRLRARLLREGPLADPAAALEAPTLPPGPYHCRLVRFGGRAGLATFAPDFCYVDTGNGGLSFTKQTGSTLPAGWIYEDTGTRHLFLGTMGPGRYGDDPARDLSGVVERVAPFRWRLVLTSARRGAVLDLYELVPVTPEVPGAPRAVPAKDDLR